mmetsp:Transcript_52055/g.110676  ORF Transcript_52055/g.110676 Transcript_52055/m.110676 type:complete len:218 (-) Transcript_52055:700-1353(-)
MTRLGIQLPVLPGRLAARRLLDLRDVPLRLPPTIREDEGEVASDAKHHEGREAVHHTHLLHPREALEENQTQREALYNEEEAERGQDEGPGVDPHQNQDNHHATNSELTIVVKLVKNVGRIQIITVIENTNSDFLQILVLSPEDWMHVIINEVRPCLLRLGSARIGSALPDGHGEQKVGLKQAQLCLGTVTLGIGKTLRDQPVKRIHLVLIPAQDGH